MWKDTAEISQIPAQLYKSFKTLSAYFTSAHAYYIAIFISVLTVSYFLSRLKLKPKVDRFSPSLGFLLPISVVTGVAFIFPVAFKYRNPIIDAINEVIFITLIYKIGDLFLRWLSSRKVDLSRYLRRLLLFLLYLGIPINIIRKLKISAALNDLLFLTAKVVLLIIVTNILLHKRAVLSLLPSIEIKLYKKLRLFFEKFYFLFVAFAILIGGFWIFGYEEIARSLFWRSTAIIAYIIALALAHHKITKKIKESTTLAKISSNLHYLWIYFETLISLVIILKLFGMYKITIAWLSYPLVKIGDAHLNFLQVVKAILIALLFYLVASTLRKIIEEIRGIPVSEKPQLRSFISKLLFYTLLGAGILISLRALGVGLSILTVFAGTLGIGIGLGLQDLARNIVGGILIYMEGHFKQSDIVSVGLDTGSPITGKIEKLDYRCVTLRTFDNIEVIIPSSMLASTMVMNWTKSDPIVRDKITIGVSYDSDPRQVEKILLEQARSHPHVLDHPEPLVIFREMGESALIFDLYIWVNQHSSNRLKVRSDLNFSIWYKLKKEGIEIPFPQLDVHIKK